MLSQRGRVGARRQRYFREVPPRSRSINGRGVARGYLCSTMSSQEKRMSKGTILSPLESPLVLITVKGQVASVGEPSRE